MSHSTDDQRILAEIERRLSQDDPALASLMSTLNQQFPGQPEQPGATRATRRSPRAVAAIVLTVIALVALFLTAILNAPPTPPAGENEGPAPRPAAMAMHPAP
ncbi:DUF3040 domain-containing protein [Streptomyces sp. NPDC093600]|uniref:DUF3040 domain-containing protein n=1 Tax=Streptomyces sp. NPDC093600 TaxID=3366047 RepID=UPI0037F824D8